MKNVWHGVLAITKSVLFICTIERRKCDIVSLSNSSQMMPPTMLFTC